MSAVKRDLARFPIRWTDGSATVRLHRTLEETEGLTEPWADWEYPRRVVYLRKREAELGDWRERLHAAAKADG